MSKILAYCTNSGIKKKIIELVALFGEFNLYLLTDHSTLEEDFALINPQNLILECNILESLIHDPVCFKILQSVPKLITIGDLKIDLAPDLSMAMLCPSFNVDELKLALINSGQSGFMDESDKNRGAMKALTYGSHDNSQLRIAEEELVREKELLQSLMDTIPDLIYFKDGESKFTRINQAQASILGLKSPGDAIGKTDFDFFPKEQAEIAFQDELEIFKSGIPLINHLEKVTPADGNTIWMSATKIPIKDRNGKITGLAGISRDITIMERASENLKYAKEKAEESNYAKSQFLANMSHEIRTPMNGIIGMADILHYTKLSTEQHSYLDIIIKSGNNLLSIINDILDLSKIESDCLTLERVPISIRGIIEDVADLLIVPANNKKLEFADYVDPAIPDIVEGDSIRLRQVLINLVNNAIKFTPKGEVYLSAELQESNDDGFQILFKVRDTGIGIPKHAVASLFKAFSQVDISTTRKYGGTGLGLAISKKLVEMMGGLLCVESEEDMGSVFWFTAKFGTATEVEPVIHPPKLRLQGLNVIVVDDNATNRFIMGKYLQTLKYKYLETGDAKTAIQMMNDAASEGHPFDIALLDYQMDEMDGFKLAETIKANPLIVETRLILLSSVTDIISPQQIRHNGFNSFLNKPVKLKDLYSVINSVTSNKEHKVSKNIVKEKASKSNLRILIVEDNPINIKVAQLIVKPFAAFVDIAVNGLLAYNKIMENEYDLILLDLQMPALNGYETTELIREYERTNNKVPVKIVAMTANAVKEDEDFCLNIGMDAYLGKPFRFEDMVGVLKKLKLL
jgi:two-component system, sensor histidine kinase and response regulator